VAQKYADKAYYLVDSLVLEELTEGDKKLIDNSLKKYHSAKEDSSQINALDDICENMMHDDWSKFQFYQYELIKKLLKTNKTKALKKSLANSLNNIGTIYNDQGDIPKAVEYYHKSFKIQEEIGDKEGIATSLNNIGYIYHNQGDIPKALEYYHKSLNIQEEIGDKEGIAISLNNIGVIYRNQGDIPKALEYNHKSLKIQEEIGNKLGIARSLNNIGMIYNNQEDIPKALTYFHKSLKIYEEIGNKEGTAYSLNNLGFNELKKGNTSGIVAAKQHLLKALEIAQEIGYPDLISKVSSNLSKVYEKQGKGMKALDMHQLHIQMRDSINNEATLKASIQQEAKYVFEKVQAVKDAAHEKQLAIEKEAKAKQQVITAATGGGLGLLAIFLLFVMNRLKVTRKQKVVIEIQNIELAKKNTEKEYMMKEIHHRVKNNLQVVSSLLRFQSIEIDDPKIVSMFENCQNRILSMASVHEQLYQSENLMEIPIDKHLLSLVTDLIKDYNIDTEIEPVINVESIDMGIKTLIPLGLIINEIVSNAIKHAFINRKKGILTISLRRIDEIRFELTIKDDGVGYQDSNSQGLGLELIEIFTQQLDASIEKRIKNGTFYKIIFKDQDK
jgi:two-component sensor histidine kinase/Tfp pilus assembly protein PilF